MSKNHNDDLIPVIEETAKKIFNIVFKIILPFIFKKIKKLSNLVFRQILPLIINLLVEKLFSPIKIMSPLLLLIVLVAYVFSYTVTHGDMNLSLNESMNITYANMWDHLLVGRYDIDPDTIGGEAFIKDGKTYTYFGPFPALLRGFLDIFLKRNSNDWARLSVILAGVITVIFFTLAYFRITLETKTHLSSRYFYTVIFALTTAFGSCLFALLSTAYIFHEALIWGLAWSSIFVWAFVCFCFDSKISPLILFFMSLSSGCTFLSRSTTGIGPLIVFTAILFLLFLESILSFTNMKQLAKFFHYIKWKKIKMTKTRAILALAAGILPFVLCVGFNLHVNYKRWGNPFSFHPHKYYGRAIGGREAALRESGGPVTLERIPYGIAYYFIPSLMDQIYDKFPYLEISGDHDFFRKNKRVHYDNIERGNAFLFNSTYLFITGLVGAFVLSQVYGLVGLILVLLYGIQCLVMLGFCSLSLRYSVEFMPFFVLLSLASFSRIISFENKNKVYWLFMRTLVLVVSLLSIYAGTMIMLRLKLHLWSVPYQVKEKITSNFERVDNLIISYSRALKKKSSDLEIIRTDGTKTPPLPILGQLWTPDNGETLFWFDGLNWIIIRDDNNKYLGPVTMKVKFNPVLGASEPLLTTGKKYEGDFVYVRYLSDGKVQLGYDHWGRPGVISKPISIDPNHFYSVEISLGSFYNSDSIDKLSNKVILKLDGKVVLDEITDFHMTTQEQIKIGKNEIEGTTCGPLFSGVIEDPRRVGNKLKI